MKKILTSDKLYISQSNIPGVGRGVYANKNIKKNETIEICPIIEVSKNDTANLKETILTTYFFYFGKHKEKSFLALGFGSIYNHSYNPNAKYKIKPKEKTIDFITLEDIAKNEEIFIDYNFANPKDKTPLWFEVD